MFMPVWILCLCSCSYVAMNSWHVYYATPCTLLALCIFVFNPFPDPYLPLLMGKQPRFLNPPKVSHHAPIPPACNPTTGMPPPNAPQSQSKSGLSICEYTSSAVKSDASPLSLVPPKVSSWSVSWPLRPLACSEGI